MLERTIQALVTDDPGRESPAVTRERLKGRFPPGSTRRMTTLGLIVGNALAQLDPAQEDSILYASGYAESRALEDFLDSFPAPSPTLFQTSIHPSAVQQLLIGRQRAVGEFIPVSGGNLLALQALRACMLSPSRGHSCAAARRQGPGSSSTAWQASARSVLPPPFHASRAPGRSAGCALSPRRARARSTSPASSTCCTPRPGLTGGSRPAGA